MKYVKWLVVVILLIQIGCSFTVDFSKPKKASPPIYNLDPIPISLSERLKNLTEHVSSWGESATLHVDKAFQLVFKDDKTSGVYLELINSQIWVSAKSTPLLTHWDSNYSISISLNTGGTKTIIYAKGISNTARGPTTAAQYAVENAIFDLYNQVKAFLSTKKSKEEK